LNPRAAKPPKKFLQAVHEENCTKTGAQQKLSIRRQRLICFAEGGTVETRFGYHGFPLRFSAALFGRHLTCASQKAMSALPPIATAKADSCTRSCLLYPESGHVQCG